MRKLLAPLLFLLAASALADGTTTVPPVKDVGAPDDVRRDVRRATESLMPRAGGDDLFYRDVKNNRIGVGTTSPACVLDLVGSACFSSTFQASTATFAYSVYMATSSGSVGIGTISPAEILEINRDGADVALRIHDPGTAEYRIGINGGESSLRIVNTNGPIDIGSSVAGILMDTAGKVGVGAAPSYQLQVVQSSTNTIARINNGGNYFDIGGLGSGTAYIRGFEGTVAMGNEFTGPLNLITGNTARVQIPNAAITTGGALCLNASNVLSKCTTAVDASGNCTCP